MTNPAVDRLLDPDRVVLFDGAMGTMLYARGVYINQCYDELNVRSPDLVREVHAEYVRAGAGGPLGVRLEPLGPTSHEEARATFREQIEGLVEGGADIILLETFSDLH